MGRFFSKGVTRRDLCSRETASTKTRGCTGSGARETSQNQVRSPLRESRERPARVDKARTAGTELRTTPQFPPGGAPPPEQRPCSWGRGARPGRAAAQSEAGQRALTPVSPRALHHHRVAQRLGFVDHLRKVFMSTCQEKQKSGKVRVMVGGLRGNSLEASRLSD